MANKTKDRAWLCPFRLSKKAQTAKKCKTKTVKSEPPSPKNIINSNQKLYKKTSEKTEVFKLFAISSSVVPLYADELEMAKSASFSTARCSLSILYRQAERTELGSVLYFSFIIGIMILITNENTVAAAPITNK